MRIIFIFECLDSHYSCLLCLDQLFILSLLSSLICLRFFNFYFTISFNSQFYKTYYFINSLAAFGSITKINNFNSILSSIALGYSNILKYYTLYFYCFHILCLLQNLHFNSQFFNKNLFIKFSPHLIYIFNFLHFFKLNYILNLNFSRPIIVF